MKLLIVILSTFFTVAASAANYTDLAFEAGFRNQNADVTNSDTSAQTAYQLGLSAAFPMVNSWSFRTGLFYTQKNFQVKATPNQNYKFTYVEIPATAMYKFMDYAGVYGGLNVSMNMDSDCNNNTCHKVESLVTPIVIGAAFKFAPQFGADVYFETYSGKIEQNTKNIKAIGANLMVTFD